jgi:hypothetical protein
MPMVTPTLNLTPPPMSSAASTKAAVAAPATPSPAATPAPAQKPADAPSTTVTLSPQAMSAMAAASHSAPPPSPTSSTASSPAPAPNDSSVYDSLKMGIASAVCDVGDAIEGGAHAVVDGVETVVSTANKVAQGILELPFAAVAKVCDAAGAIIDSV